MTTKPISETGLSLYVKLNQLLNDPLESHIRINAFVDALIGATQITNVMLVLPAEHVPPLTIRHAVDRIRDTGRTVTYGRKAFLNNGAGYKESPSNPFDPGFWQNAIYRVLTEAALFGCTETLLDAEPGAKHSTCGWLHAISTGYSLPSDRFERLKHAILRAIEFSCDIDDIFPGWSAKENNYVNATRHLGNRIIFTPYGTPAGPIPGLHPPHHKPSVHTWALNVDVAADPANNVISVADALRWRWDLCEAAYPTLTPSGRIVFVRFSRIVPVLKAFTALALD